MKILLIEDDAAIAKVVRKGLEQAHFTIVSVQDGQAGLKAALTNEYHLIILDLMLPGMDGMCICRELRAARLDVPILMLTARSSIPDRVRGLEAGADDYLPKPFSFSELLARVQALLRRDKVHRARLIRIDDLEIDTKLRRVTLAGHELSLTPREYLLIEALALHEGHVLTREMILQRIWADEESLSNIVDVYIGQLRRKMDACGERRLIQTIRGLGYTLRREP